jgi:hypothetical protein
MGITIVFDEENDAGGHARFPLAFGATRTRHARPPPMPAKRWRVIVIAAALTRRSKQTLALGGDAGLPLPL